MTSRDSGLNPRAKGELNIILDFIRDYFACPWIGAEDNLVTAIPLDSLRYLELVIFLEKRFSLKVPDHFLRSKTLGSAAAIAEMIQNQKRARP